VFKWTYARFPEVPMFRLIRFVIILAILVLALAWLGGYWRPFSTPTAPASADDVERARQRGGELAKEGAEKAKEVGRDLSTAAAKAADAVGEATADGTITAKIKSKMALDEYVKASAIDVDTKDGIVTLTGTVATGRERDRALQLARETSGVKQVVDRLAVK
jgi:osmotically-inducible protein OsmY